MQRRRSIVFALFALCAAVPATPADKTPGQVYLDYRSAVLAGKSFKDLEPFLTAEMIQGMPAEVQQKLFERHKSMAATEDVPKVVKEEPDVDGVRVHLEATWDFSKSGGEGKKPARALARFVKQGNQWKLVVLPQWVVR
jgi:hypothetical protein